MATANDREGSHEPSALVAGKRFHRDVKAGYVAGLVGVELSDAAERIIVRLVTKGDEPTSC
jgi:hypothetical protein